MPLKLIFFLTIICVSSSFANDNYNNLILYAGETESTNYSNALKLYGLAIQIDPDNPEAYIRRGVLLYSHSDYISSYRDFKTAVKIEPNKDKKQSEIKSIDYLTCTRFIGSNAEEESKKAMDLIMKGDSKEAILVLLDLIITNTQNAFIYYQLGYAWTELKDYSKASDYLEKGRLVNPVYENILLELKYVYSETKKLEKLDEVINDLMNFYGENPVLYQDLGFAYAESGNFGRAAQVFETSINKFSDYYITYFILGQIYYQTGKFESAKIYLRKFYYKVNQSDFDKYKIDEDISAYKLRAKIMLDDMSNYSASSSSQGSRDAP